MILLNFLICFFWNSQSFEKVLDKNVKAAETNKNEIVFIFKKQNQAEDLNSKIDVLGSAVYYSGINDFTVIELSPDNSLKNDTIVTVIPSDKIHLSHTYNKVKRYLYEFQKGDTVVFDYTKGYPYASVINRESLKYDINFAADIKNEKPLEDFEFVLKNGRIRNDTEKKSYFKELNKYRLKVDKTLDSIRDKNLISQSIYEMFKASNKFFEINTNKSLLKSVATEDLKRDDLVSLKTYRHFLNNYVIERFRLKTQFNNEPMTCNSKIAFDSIEKSPLFSKRVRESLLYTHLVNIAEKNSNDDLNVYFKKFQRIVNDSSLNEKIRNNYLVDFNDLKKEVAAIYFTDLDKSKITLDMLISENKGKVIFVDFWASWCAPCRIAMPYSKKLKDEYKDKDIVFIYISIDTDFEKWKNASGKENLPTNRNNLLALNYPDGIFYKTLELKAIPRYLIYDKKGRLVHKNTPGPESEEIRNELNKYLKE